MYMSLLGKRFVLLSLLILVAVSLKAWNETVTMNVGDILTLRYPSHITEKILAGMPAPVSTDFDKVRVNSFNYSGVTIQAVEPTENSTVLINVTYYYYITNGSYTYQMRNAYDYKIIVKELTSGGGDDPVIPSTSPTGISLPSSITIDKGGSRTITPTIKPSSATATVTWSSENPEIATIFRSGDITGYLKGIEYGTTTITARTQNGHTASCQVKVGMPDIKLTVDTKSGTYRPGKKVSLSASEKDAVIYYTLDGTMPSNTSYIYDEPIVLNSSSTLRAIAVKEGFNASNEINEMYEISLDAEIVFDKGKGTISNPYIVSTADQLTLLSKYKSSYFKQDCDIELPNESWNPVGDESEPFKGSYDGCGFKIKGLRINSPTEDYVGLFGYTQKAKLKNIVLTDIQIEGRDYVGALAGYSAESEVSNIAVDGDVSAQNNVGGIIGQVYTPTKIEKCNYSGTITGNENVGGIVGYYQTYYYFVTGTYTGDGSGLNWKYEKNINWNIKSCKVSAQIKGGTCVGGCVGYQQLENYTQGNPVRGKFGSSFSMYVTLSGLVSDIVCEGSIMADSIAGGIIGKSLLDNYCRAEGFYGRVIDGYTGESYMTCTYQNSYAKNTIKVTNAHNTMIIKGENCLGGIIGRIYDDSQTSVGDLGVAKIDTWYTLEECSNNGNILGNDGASGGIIGESNVKSYPAPVTPISIKNCVSSCQKIEGGAFCSGIIGVNHATRSIDISNSLVLGNISALSGTACGIMVNDNLAAKSSISACVIALSTISGKESVQRVGSVEEGVTNLMSKNTKVFLKGVPVEEDGSLENVTFVEDSLLYDVETYSNLDWSIASGETKIWKVEEDLYYPYLSVQSKPLMSKPLFESSTDYNVVRGCADCEGIVYVQKNNETCSSAIRNGFWSLKVPWQFHEGDTVQVYMADEDKAPSISKFVVIDKIGNYVAPVDSVILNCDSISLFVDEKYDMQMSVAPSGVDYKSVIWKSSNEDVATVSNSGIVSAVSEGMTEISVTVVNYDETTVSVSCRVKVSNRYRLSYYVDNELYISMIYKSGSEILPVDTPVKYGNVFVGWLNLPRYMPANNVNVYGYFEKVSSIDNVEFDNDARATVYNLQGILLKSGVYKDIIKDIPNGLYIINGKKAYIIHNQ